MSSLHALSYSQWEFQPDHEAVTALEKGKVLFFPHLSFNVLPEEQALLSPHFSNGKSKNISFDMKDQTLKGIQGNLEEKHLMKNFLNRYALQTNALVKSLIPAYAGVIQMGRTSFRPVEISGRKAPSYRKDDTRLHVDAFPASPNQGKRLLRVFCNIHPDKKPRVWRVGEPFEKVAERFVPQIPSPVPFSNQLLKSLGITKSLRTAYDHFMLQIHHRMKKDTNYQQAVNAEEIAFPPGTTWMVFTDRVSHAVLSGQHLLEQTFYLPVSGMHDESLSPLRILEQLTAKKLV